MSKIWAISYFKYFKNYIQKSYSAIMNILDKKISTGKCILWIDNYSKFFKQTNLTNGGFLPCKWSAMGLLECETLSFTKTFSLFIIPPKPLISINKKDLLALINNGFDKIYD